MAPEKLLEYAENARLHSYCPYSGFAVGAPLLTADGRVFTGCNVENAAFSPTLCAERVAIAKAVSEGETRFAALAIVGGSKEKPGGFCPPCGVCRQLIREFAEDTLPVYLRGEDNGVQRYTLSQLLPVSFSPTALERS